GGDDVALLEAGDRSRGERRAVSLTGEPHRAVVADEHRAGGHRAVDEATEMEGGEGAEHGARHHDGGPGTQPGDGTEPPEADLRPALPLGAHEAAEGTAPHGPLSGPPVPSGYHRAPCGLGRFLRARV